MAEYQLQENTLSFQGLELSLDFVDSSAYIRSPYTLSENTISFDGLFAPSFYTDTSSLIKAFVVNENSLKFMGWKPSELTTGQIWPLGYV